MQDSRDHRYYEAESLEKNLVSTRCSVLDDMVTLKESMSKQETLLKASKHKAEELHRKIIMLEAAESRSKQVANTYRHKLDKL